MIETVSVDASSRGSWNLVEIGIFGREYENRFYFNINDDFDEIINGNIPLRGSAACSSVFEKKLRSVFYIPENARAISLFIIGDGAESLKGMGLYVKPVGRARASNCLLLQARRAAFVQLARSAITRPAALPHHIRQLLATTARDTRPAQWDYGTWLKFFDIWPEGGTRSGAATAIAYLVFARDASSEALAATLRSIAVQDGGPVHVVLDRAAGMSPRDAVETLRADYIGVLQAGEVLPRHATRAAASQLEQLGHPDIAITDDDDIGLDGVRENPRMKPTPNHALMLSGTLSRGLWLMKRATLLEHAATADWAEELRLRVWLARRRAGRGGFSVRIPYLLSHRRPDAEAAPPEALAAVVARHLDGHGPAIVPIATSPLSFRIRDGAGGESVTAIIPSTLRKPESLRCIQEVLRGTDHPSFDVRVVVMQPNPLDRTQEAAVEALRRFPNVGVSWVQAPEFNFSKANNAAALGLSSEYVLLLNDDVAPIRPDWLRWMSAFLFDPDVGAVGARLLYPDGTVQHGGVIMGLAGPCEHAHRNLPAGEPGYMRRAVLAQELSAVTAACMLVRRSLYERLGGLDENYPSAFNDVDFALRIGEAGHEVLYVPQAELLHYESQTYGSHYAGGREAFFEEEVRRLRTRWARVIAADPFHNPNLALSNGFEWQLAFPPRTGILE